MFKSFKIRIYPNKKQKESIWLHIHSQRFIWNYLLDLQNKEYESTKKYLSKFDMTTIITNMRKEQQYSFLENVSLGSLRNVAVELNREFEIFFKTKRKSMRPKFKKKKNTKQNFSIRQDIGKFYFKTERLCHIEKIGDVKFKTDFNINLGNKIKYYNPIVIVEDNKYYIFFSLKYEKQVVKLNDYVVGIDLGIKKLAVVVYENNVVKFESVNKSLKIQQLKKRKKQIQKNLSRKYRQNKNTFKNSNRYKKELNKYYKVLDKISNIRKNQLHQISRQIVNLNPKRIVMEALNILELSKKDEKWMRNLIREQCFYTFKKNIKYKSEERRNRICRGKSVLSIK